MHDGSAPDAFTTLLQRWQDGDARAGEALLARAYAELRGLAACWLRDSGGGVTLQPTALVNEGLMKLLGQVGEFESRAHFFGSAARAMRQVLVDAARRRQAGKRGGGEAALTLGAADAQGTDPIDLLLLDDVLRRLEALDPQQARIVELRYFVGLSIEDTAAALGLHPSTVNRDWAMARAWLRRALAG
jgi:RNA polymerase sigma-70 factor (ECF subfamily)